MTQSVVEKHNNARYVEGYCTDLEAIRKLEYPLINGIAFIFS
jgi:hypothetical protein